MDISNRNTQAHSAGPSGQNLNTANAGGARRGKSLDDNKWGRIGLVAALVALAVLLAGIIALSVGDNSGDGNNKTEASYVDTSKLQAVFLNTGQVYFGNIKSLNNKFFVLSNIYYLQTGNGGNNNANSSVTLVKLGCELHQPDDQMVINSEQVTFWENLGDNGQVAKAVADFKQKNPQGQKCADQSTSASPTSGNAAQNASGNNAPATNNRD